MRRTVARCLLALCMGLMYGGEAAALGPDNTPFDENYRDPPLPTRLPPSETTRPRPRPRAPAKPKPQTHRSANSLLWAEGLGAGLFYSVNFEQFFIKWLSLRVGASYFQTGNSTTINGVTTDLRQRFVIFPLTLNFVWSRGSHGLEVGAGGALVVAQVPENHTPQSGALFNVAAGGVAGWGYLGVGYRFQALKGGVALRVGMSMLVGPGLWLALTEAGSGVPWGLLPWPYASVGWAF